MAVALTFFLGACVFLYPTVSNYFAQKNSSRVSDEYTTAVTLYDQEMLARERQKAIEYNEALLGDPVRDPFLEGSGMALPMNYLEVLNVGGTMCTIEIPKIQVKLPVSHGTSRAVLESGVGHVQETALPVGGQGCHSVLTAHTGHASAKLFTDLINLKRGDMFVIYVLSDILYYMVDDVSVIEPEEISMLEPIAGLDCVTLVTCTPYGVNSHRLLVRGVRTEYTPQAQRLLQPEITLYDRLKPYLPIIVVALFFALLLAILLIDTKARKIRRPLLAAAPRDEKEQNEKPPERQRTIEELIDEFEEDSIEEPIDDD